MSVVLSEMADVVLLGICNLARLNYRLSRDIGLYYISHQKHVRACEPSTKMRL